MSCCLRGRAVLGQALPPRRSGPDEAARKRKAQINWYSTLIINQILRPMAEAFEAKYPGIKMNIPAPGQLRYGTEDLQRGTGAPAFRPTCSTAPTPSSVLEDAKLVANSSRARRHPVPPNSMIPRAIGWR